jgi:hypothetical protein
MFPVSVTGTVRLKMGVPATDAMVRAACDRIAGMLHWEKVQSVSIGSGRVTFANDTWRLKARSIILLFERGVFDIEADNEYVRVRYRVDTIHQTIATLFIATAFGALSAIAYEGLWDRKVLAALVVMGWIGGWLWGFIFVSAKIFVPLWLRRGLRKDPELRKR